jgi:predicted nucleic acid-binding protein
VYLDTNVFDNLLKKTNGVTHADELQLCAAVTSRQLKIVASHINLRETIAALRSRPEIARAQLRLIVSLADWDRFIRFSSEVLEDDIRHFAFNGERANTPFERDREADHIRLVTQRIIDGHIGLKELDPAIEEDHNQKRAFLEGIKKSRAQTAMALQEFRKTSEIPSFEQFFEDGAEAHALAFVKSFGVAEECERRGLDKLLKIPTIRVMVGLAMSFIYRIVAEEKAPKKSSASRDLQHAACAAAAADIFVTHDVELAFLLHRVPIKGFRVLGLHQLLEETSHSNLT